MDPQPSPAASRRLVSRGVAEGADGVSGLGPALGEPEACA